MTDHIEKINFYWGGGGAFFYFLSLDQRDHLFKLALKQFILLALKSFILFNLNQVNLLILTEQVCLYIN